MSEPYEPLRVHVAGIDAGVQLTPPAPPRPRRRRAMVARSFVLNTNDPAQEILPQADARCEAYILSFTNAIVIGGSKGDALAGTNASAQIPAGIAPVPLPTTDAVWAGSATLPTTISVIAFYDQPER